MYLEENLQRLNKRYNPLGIEFHKEGKIVRVIEKKPYLLNDNPNLKNELRTHFAMRFNQNLLWHLGTDGISNLSKEKIKTEPYEDINKMKMKLHSYIEMIDEEKLKKSILKLLSKNLKFYEAPAAKTCHHNYTGGLLEHVIQTIQLALSIINTFDQDILIDKDLIIAGAFLHDIGKINCYDCTEEAIDITPLFLLQNHIINGIKLISQEIESEKLDEIIHIVASHHHIPEWGSPVKPITNEAWIIHLSENLSSKIMG